MANGHGRSTEGFGVDRKTSIDLIVRTALENGVDDPRQIAYLLATAQHETENFKAPEEHFGRSQALRLGYSGGEDYYGRGYVHLTHDYNYRQFDELLALDGELVRNPDKAKDPEIAARILVLGMRDGLFTGKRMDRYINGDTLDYYEARRVVNGVSARQPWSVKAAEDCELHAGRWESEAPALIESARNWIAAESLDPVRDLQQAVTHATGIEHRDARITDGMPDYLRVPTPRPDNTMNDGKLRHGESGAAVRDLQERLNDLGIADGRGRPLEPDAAFGRSTREAVENFQLWHGLPTTGIADQDTLDAMRKAQTTARGAPPETVAEATPADPGHPDHANLEKIRAGVLGIEQRSCREYGEDSERLSRCLLAASKESLGVASDRTGTPTSSALERIDHVVMGKDGRNAFVVQGDLHDPAHKRAHVDVEQARQTPVETSDLKLDAANQQLAEERRLAIQQDLQQRQAGSPDTQMGGPVLRT